MTEVFLQSFWQLGKAALEPTIKSIALSKLKAPVKETVIERTQHLPAWITNNILFKPNNPGHRFILKRKNQNGKNEPIIDYEILDILRAAHNQEQRGPDLFEDIHWKKVMISKIQFRRHHRKRRRRRRLMNRNDEFEKDDDDDANDESQRCEGRRCSLIQSQSKRESSVTAALPFSLFLQSVEQGCITSRGKK